jgi:hypothetical protein
MSREYQIRCKSFGNCELRVTNNEWKTLLFVTPQFVALMDRDGEAEGFK